MERLATIIAGERDGVFFVTSERAGLGSVAENRPDLVLVADYLRQGNRESFTRLVNGTQNTAPTPVVWLCNTTDADAYLAATSAGADELFFGEEEEIAILARTRPLVRLSTLYGEMWRRFSVARRFHLDPESVPLPPEEDHRPKLLIVETVKGDGLAEEMDSGDDCEVTADPVDAEQRLSSGKYDALLFDATDREVDWEDFCRRIRNHPRLFHLPIIAATSGERQVDSALYGAGATQVVFRYGDKAVWKFLSAARERNFRLRSRFDRSLRRTMVDDTVDPLTWTYSPEFLAEHLSSAVGTSKAMRHSLSVIRFRIANYDEMSDEFPLPGLYHALQQAAQWIAHLLRAEDLVARSEHDEFTIVLPNTPIHEAEIVRDRILGVVLNTDMAVYDVYKPVAVDLIAGIAALRPDDSASGLLGRASPA
ncbi:MAG: diguanylate cyclase [Rhodospirillales bacterium]